MEDSPSAQGTCGRVREHRRDPDVLDMERLIPKPSLCGRRWRPGRGWHLGPAGRKAGCSERESERASSRFRGREWGALWSAVGEAGSILSAEGFGVALNTRVDVGLEPLLMLQTRLW